MKMQEEMRIAHTNRLIYNPTKMEIYGCPRQR